MFNSTITRSLLGLVLSIAVCLPGKASAETAHERKATTNTPIRIGIMITLSGHGSNASKEAMSGFSLFWESVGNSASGRKVEFITEDDQNSLEIAEMKMNKLVNEKHIDIFTGLRYTPIAYCLAPRIDTEYKLPFIILISSGDALTSTKHPKWLLRTEFSTAQLVMPLADYAYRQLGLRRIATIAVRNVWASEAVDDFEKAFERCGGQIIQKIWVARDATDVTQKLGTLRKDVDGVFQMTDETNSWVVAHGLKKLKIKVPLLAQGGVTDVQPPDPTSLPQYITVMPYNLDLNTPANKTFVSQYRKRYHTDPNYWAELGYTTAMILHAAIEARKGNVEDREQMLNAIRTVQVEAPNGHESFDSEGQVVQNIFIRRTNVVGGKLVNTVIYTYPHVSHMGKSGP